MSKEAMRLALGKIKSARDCHQNAVDTLLFEAEEILEAELAKPDFWEGYVPEPVKPAQLPFGVGGGLVAIKTLLSRDPCVHANTAIQMIDAILAEQPAPVAKPHEPEPVAWMVECGGDSALVRHTENFPGIFAGNEFNKRPLVFGDKSPPAQRTWVGLSEEDREQHRNDWHSNIHDKEFQAIEAKIKEKNNG